MSAFWFGFEVETVGCLIVEFSMFVWIQGFLIRTFVEERAFGYSVRICSDRTFGGNKVILFKDNESIMFST